YLNAGASDHFATLADRAPRKSLVSKELRAGQAVCRPFNRWSAKRAAFVARHTWPGERRQATSEGLRPPAAPARRPRPFARTPARSWLQTAVPATAARGPTIPTAPTRLLAAILGESSRPLASKHRSLLPPAVACWPAARASPRHFG